MTVRRLGGARRPLGRTRRGAGCGATPLAPQPYSACSGPHRAATAEVVPAADRDVIARGAFFPVSFPPSRRARAFAVSAVVGVICPVVTVLMPIALPSWPTWVVLMTPVPPKTNAVAIAPEEVLT